MSYIESYIEAEAMLTEKCFHFSKFLKHLISDELDYFFINCGQQIR